MEQLKEALERIDSSFSFALAGRERAARQQFEQGWPLFLENLRREQSNVTLPGERELVAQMTNLAEKYRRQGDVFYARPSCAAAGAAGLSASSTGSLLAALTMSAGATDSQHEDYFGPYGLLDTFTQTKDTADRILRLNQGNMEHASADARRTARDSLIGFGLGLGATAILAGTLAWSTLRAILRPIQAVTMSVNSIGAGDLDQVVPIMSSDELGQLAEAFNGMARQLRHYRQTDYARLLRAQRTSQASIDSFPDPVLVVDPEGRVEMANPAAQLLFGLGARNSETLGSVEWNPPEDLREPLRDALANQRQYVPEEFDHAIPLRIKGEERSFLPRVLPIRDPYGHTLGAALLLEDVTRFRLLDQIKSDLVATASHELKTPLTSVRLALYLLLEESVGPLTPKQTELLIDARDNAERLLAIVNHLLDLAKLEQKRGQIEPRRALPADLLAHAAEAIALQAVDKGVTVAVDASPELPLVLVDGQRLGRVLDNLLDNAVTYTDRGGLITLSATAAKGRVIMSVADTGIGIPAEHLPRIFQKFFRIPGHSRESSTGLGLAIVHEIVTAHGGTITCESAVGRGTVFRISLPIAE
jgi:PAS domain S-box-containing protein